jgi:hypothetical protein
MLTLRAMNMVTRFSVLVHHDVDADADLDADGAIRGEVVARVAEAAVDAYLDQCPVLAQACERADVVLARDLDLPPAGAFPGRSAQLIVTASASEFAPDRITMSVRMRSWGGDDERVANARCRLRPTGGSEPFEFGDDVRDELIAHEHAARHFN